MKRLLNNLTRVFPARYVGSGVPGNLRGALDSARTTRAELGATAPDHHEGSQEIVVLVGPADWPHNLYLAEAISSSGYRVEMVSDAEVSPKALHWLDFRRVESFDTDALADLLYSYEEDARVRWIIPVVEDTIWAVRALLPHSEKVFSPLSSENAARLSSKQSMSKFAVKLGITVPQEFAIDSLNEAILASGALGFPCVLKGEGGCGGSQVAICRNDEELRIAWSRLKTKNPSLQEFVDGEPWAAGGFFVEGQPFRLHIYQKLAQSPPGIGPPTRIRHDSPLELQNALFLIARSMKWTGFLQVDFVRRADGEFCFLEINPRPWGSMTAVNACGRDVFAPFVDVLRNRTPDSDLGNSDGWAGYVFPKPVLNEVSSGHLVSALLDMLSPRFWRSIPKGYALATRSHLYEILNVKKAYWGVSRRISLRVRPG